jgi:histone-lysine N-methyltransferase SETD2
MTEDYAIHRQLVRMHGLSLMFMILTELGENRELVLLVSRDVRFQGGLG